MTNVNDIERRTRYTPVVATDSFEIGFPIFEDGRYATAPEYADDLKVYLNDVEQTSGWTLSAVFVDGVDENATIEVTAPGWTGTVDIVGASPPRRTTQFASGRGISEDAWNLVHNILQARLREIYDRLERGPLYAPDGDPIDFRGRRLTNLGAGTGATDALTKAQIEALVALVNSGGLAYAALLVTYLNDVSGLSAETVQAAIDEIVVRLGDAETDIAALLVAIDSLTLSVAQNRILGRVSSGTGSAEQLTGAQVTNLLSLMTGDSGAGGARGLVPPPPAGSAARRKVLWADGAFDYARQNTLIARHQTNSGTAGGTLTAGAWRTRTLNALNLNEIINASLAADRITLPAGTYDAEGFGVAYSVGLHKCRLYDITNATTLVVGSSASAPASGNHCTTSHFKGRFTLAGAVSIELQHYSSATEATDGFGLAVSSGELEIYGQVRITQLDD